MVNLENFNKLKKELENAQVRLVAVSKTKPAEDIQVLYNEGQRVFGENRALELAEKYALLPQDIQWHMIGHLQTNKVKYIAPFVAMIESIDSIKLLKEVNKQGKNNNRVIPVLLEFKIAEEDSKHGLEIEEVETFLRSAEIDQLTNVRIEGVMGMATFTDQAEQVKREFRHLKEIFDTLKNQYFQEKPFFSTLSMGMSGDYPLAIEAGATQVRVGSLLFGNRS